MAKATDNTATEAPTLGGGIIDFAEAAKPNKYTETVQALIDAGEGKAYKLVVPATEVRGEGEKARTVNVAQAERLAFQNAANDLDKTARVAPGYPVIDAESNTATFIFTLKAKYNKPKLGPRGGKPTVEVAPDAEATAE